MGEGRRGKPGNGPYHAPVIESDRCPGQPRRKIRQRSSGVHAHAERSLWGSLRPRPTSLIRKGALVPTIVFHGDRDITLNARNASPRGTCV
jgi:hypothetical protein